MGCNLEPGPGHCDDEAAIQTLDKKGAGWLDLLGHPVNGSGEAWRNCYNSKFVEL